tara:strand:- start:953 stop:1972 length:1020 start_codon:yes stop_codon:yes gene_type:complete
MNKKIFILTSVILLVSFYLNISFGDASIGINKILLSLFGIDFNIPEVSKFIFYEIRLPRVIIAFIVGSILALSGTIMQAIFRNPLADPGLIGVSSGGAVGAILFIISANYLNAHTFMWLQDSGMIIFPMIGAMATTFLVYKLSQSNGKTNVAVMLLTGLAINAIAGTIIGYATYFSTDDQLRSFTFWSLGSLGRADWGLVQVLFPLTVIAIIYKISLRRELNLMLLGEREALYLGVNIEKTRRNLIIVTSSIVGLTVSICGMIGFIGLITPHICRLIFGPNHNLLLPLSGMVGGIILVNADLVSRISIPYSELPIGIVTSLIGAPFFLYLIIKTKKVLF